MTSQLQPLTSPSTEPYIGGMSDEEELRRAGLAHANAQGNGEVLLDFSDEIKDLGLEQ